MNPNWVQIRDLKYFWKILIHKNPQARWIYFLNVPLCSDFSELVGFGGSLFYRDIWDLWSVANTDSCIKGPQDSKKMLVTYYTSTQGQNYKVTKSGFWILDFSGSIIFFINMYLRYVICTLSGFMYFWLDSLVIFKSDPYLRHLAVMFELEPFCVFISKRVGSQMQ